MNFNLEKLTQQIMNAIVSCDNIDIHSMDLNPVLSEDGTEIIFNMSKYIDIPSENSKGSIPIGHINYAVTIKATYDDYENN